MAEGLLSFPKLTWTKKKRRRLPSKANGAITAVDVGAEETASPSSAARAKRIRAEIGDEPLTGIES